MVIGWTAALVYDTPEGALPVMQLLEYANSQLIEFRYYDEMLTRCWRTSTARWTKARACWRAGAWRGRPGG